MPLLSTVFQVALPSVLSIVYMVSRFCWPRRMLKKVVGSWLVLVKVKTVGHIITHGRGVVVDVSVPDAFAEAGVVRATERQLRRYVVRDDRYRVRVSGLRKQWLYRYCPPTDRWRSVVASRWFSQGNVASRVPIANYAPRSRVR